MRLRSSRPLDSKRAGSAVAARHAGPGPRWPSGRDLASACVATGLLAALSGCPSAPQRKPDDAKKEPTLLTDAQLCQGGSGDPAGEQDPRCAADASHERVILVHHAAGCQAGLRGPVDFVLERRDGDEVKRQVLATLAPGERKVFQLPRGESEVIVAGDDARPLALGGAGPVTVEVGCGPEAFRGRGLQPLVLFGAELSCSRKDGEALATAPIKVRAGGLDLVVGPREAQTIFLPIGSHLIKVAGETRTIEVGEGGLTVPLGTCRDVP